MTSLPHFLAALVLAAVSLSAQTGTTAGELPLNLEGVAINQNLDGQLPLDARFRDEQGREVELGSFFGNRPVILALVYYECPMLCSLELKGLLRSIKIVPLDLASDYEIVTVSFDPDESSELAAKSKAEYVGGYGRPGAEDGWHFLTGDAENIRRLTEAAGFEYVYQPETGEFSHASAVMVTTVDGKLSQYFYGVDYSPKDLRLALVEASEGRIGTFVDQVLLFCFHYDPAMGRYTLVVMNVLRALGVLTVLAIVGFLFFSLRRERRARNNPLEHGVRV